MATVSQRNVSSVFAGFEAYSVFLRIAHFTVTGYEARFDLVLIHFVLLYYVNHALLVLTLFKLYLYWKRKEVCIKRRSSLASR